MELVELKNVITYWLLQGEIYNFIKVWLLAYLSLSYCYFSGKWLSRGAIRLIAFFPVIGLFFGLPMYLRSVHLSGIIGFFLSWLANFKLLMFAFHKGPLSENRSISLPKFIALASLPIKLVQSNPDQKQKPQYKSLINYSIKILLFSFVVKLYDYKNSINSVFLMLIYILHLYLFLELMLAFAQAMARGLLGAELEPQFDEPYLSSSLQDFWGRRWNLMVTRILRPTVYLPVLGYSSRIIGRKWATLPAVMATFIVSGLIHELIIFYMGREKHTWELTWFFILHGACVMIEITVKKAVNGRWQLPRVVATILTVGFALVTGLWLFLPEFLRCGLDRKALLELNVVGAFVKDLVQALLR